MLSENILATKISRFRVYTTTTEVPEFIMYLRIGCTAVMVAADQGDSEALELLIEAGANINCRVSKVRLSVLTTITNTPLHT